MICRVPEVILQLNGSLSPDLIPKIVEALEKLDEVESAHQTMSLKEDGFWEHRVMVYPAHKAYKPSKKR